METGEGDVQGGDSPPRHPLPGHPVARTSPGRPLDIAATGPSGRSDSSSSSSTDDWGNGDRISSVAPVFPELLAQVPRLDLTGVLTPPSGRGGGVGGASEAASYYDALGTPPATASRIDLDVPSTSRPANGGGPSRYAFVPAVDGAAVSESSPVLPRSSRAGSVAWGGGALDRGAPSPPPPPPQLDASTRGFDDPGRSDAAPCDDPEPVASTSGRIGAASLLTAWQASDSSSRAAAAATAAPSPPQQLAPSSPVMPFAPGSPPTLPEALQLAAGAGRDASGLDASTSGFRGAQQLRPAGDAPASVSDDAPTAAGSGGVVGLIRRTSSSASSANSRGLSGSTSESDSLAALAPPRIQPRDFSQAARPERTPGSSMHGSSMHGSSMHGGSMYGSRRGPTKTASLLALAAARKGFSSRGSATDLSRQPPRSSSPQPQAQPSLVRRMSFTPAEVRPDAAF